MAIKVPIPLNATNLEVKDKLILVQFNDGGFEMYEVISDIVQVRSLIILIVQIIRCAYKVFKTGVSF